jgi:L-amino acid N-acyltransferase YncA
MNGREPFPGLEMRPVEPSDAEAVTRMYRQLTDEHLYFRFWTLMPDPGPMVRSHLRLVDGRDHGGLIALDGDDVVGLAQWDRLRDDHSTAEISVVVDEAWQHRGLGRALTRAAAGDASRHAVGSVVARVLGTNHAAKGLASGQAPLAIEHDGTETLYSYQLAS